LKKPRSKPKGPQQVWQAWPKDRKGCRDLERDLEKGTRKQAHTGQLGADPKGASLGSEAGVLEKGIGKKHASSKEQQLLLRSKVLEKG